MISGLVRGGREAVISLSVRGPNRHERIVDAIVDTGFTGFATLPLSVVEDLGLPRIALSRAILADGSAVVFTLYEAEMLWDGHWRTVEAGAIEPDALVGMSLLAGYSLYLEASVDGRVTLEALA